VLQSKDAIVQRPLVQKHLGTAGRSPNRAGASLGHSLKETAARAAQEAERNAISDALRTTRGNKSEAARALKTDYKTLHLKMKHLGLKARDFGA
jgi:DNA-binding NtrC family response regulator